MRKGFNRKNYSSQLIWKRCEQFSLVFKWSDAGCRSLGTTSGYWSSTTMMIPACREWTVQRDTIYAHTSRIGYKARSWSRRVRHDSYLRNSFLWKNWRILNKAWLFWQLDQAAKLIEVRSKKGWRVIIDGAGCSGGRTPWCSPPGLSWHQQLRAGTGWGAERGYCVFIVRNNGQYLCCHRGESHPLYLSLNHIWFDGWCWRWGSERGE